MSEKFRLAGLRRFSSQVQFSPASLPWPCINSWLLYGTDQESGMCHTSELTLEMLFPCFWQWNVEGNFIWPGQCKLTEQYLDITIKDTVNVRDSNFSCSKVSANRRANHTACLVHAQQLWTPAEQVCTGVLQNWVGWKMLQIQAKWQLLGSSGTMQTNTQQWDFILNKCLFMTNLYNLWFICLFKQLPAKWSYYAVIWGGCRIQLVSVRTHAHQKSLAQYCMARQEYREVISWTSMKRSVDSQTNCQKFISLLAVGKLDMSGTDDCSNIVNH